MKSPKKPSSESDRAIERDRVLRDLENLAGLLLGDVELLADLLDARLVPELLHQLRAASFHGADRHPLLTGDLSIELPLNDQLKHLVLLGG